jgi:hypothetical protein
MGTAGFEQHEQELDMCLRASPLQAQAAFLAARVADIIDRLGEEGEEFVSLTQVMNCKIKTALAPAIYMPVTSFCSSCRQFALACAGT